jgi:hypothetical protein
MRPYYDCDYSVEKSPGAWTAGRRRALSNKTPKNLIIVTGSENSGGVFGA